MNMEQVYLRYQDLQAYAGWTEADAARVRDLGPLASKQFADIVDDFYAEIDRHPVPRRAITGGSEQVARLKRSLSNWLSQLFSGVYDAEYVACRRAVGSRHVEIGLEQVYANMALARLRGKLTQALAAELAAAGRPAEESLRSLNKLLDLDLAVIEDAYEQEYRERLSRQERLAAIGQIAGGVAHELRNPLNVLKTSAYYLLHAKSPPPEKVAEHLERINRQVGLADEVITALTDFARLPQPEVDAIPVELCLREAVEASHVPPSVRVEYSMPAGLPRFHGDGRQLGIVFRNLIRNAVEAMPDGGPLNLVATASEGGVRVDVVDRGCGIPRQDLERIMEPLYSTKARGLGLGLAISRAMLERHGGVLSVQSELGQGTTFTVQLPARDARN